MNKPSISIYLLQQILKTYGYYDGEVDGCDGPKTKEAVGIFYSHHPVRNAVNPQVDEMLDVFYANKHLHDKVKKCRKESE